MTQNTEISLKAYIAFNSIYLFCMPLVTFVEWLKIPKESFSILAILLLFDYLTGILKVVRLGETLKSYRAISGVLTKGLILVLVFALALMGKGLCLDFELYLSSFLSVLIISETYSIFGNAYSAINKENIAEYDAVSMIIKRMRNTLERILINKRNES